MSTHAWFMILAFGVLAAVGCTMHSTAGAPLQSPPPYTSYSTPPELVAVDSGVWVVRDSEQPIYFDDTYYYAYRDRSWYRSTTPAGGWIHIDIDVVPTTIVARDHDRYRHYRGGPDAVVRRAPERPNIAAPTPSTPYEPPPKVSAPTAIGGGPPPPPPAIATPNWAPPPAPPRVDEPKSLPPKGEAPRVEPPKAEPPAPRLEPPRAEPPRAPPPTVEPPKQPPTKTVPPPIVEPPDQPPPRAEPPKAPPKQPPPKAEPPKQPPPKAEPPKAEPPKAPPPKAEPPKGKDDHPGKGGGPPPHKEPKKDKGK